MEEVKAQCHHHVIRSPLLINVQTEPLGGEVKWPDRDRTVVWPQHQLSPVELPWILYPCCLPFINTSTNPQNSHGPLRVPFWGTDTRSHQVFVRLNYLLPQSRQGFKSRQGLRFRESPNLVFHGHDNFGESFTIPTSPGCFSSGKLLPILLTPFEILNYNTLQIFFIGRFLEPY